MRNIYLFLIIKSRSGKKRSSSLRGRFWRKKEFQILSDRVENYDKGIENLKTLNRCLTLRQNTSCQSRRGFMSAKSYRNKVAEPLVQKLKSLVKTALIRCFEAWDSYYRLNVTNSNLHRENDGLRRTNEKLAGENENLRAEKQRL